MVVDVVPLADSCFDQGKLLCRGSLPDGRRVYVFVPVGATAGEVRRCLEWAAENGHAHTPDGWRAARPNTAVIRGAAAKTLAGSVRVPVQTGGG